MQNTYIYFSGNVSLSLWGNKRPHHWLRAMLLKNGSVLKISSERFCFALFLKMWGQLDTEGSSPYCKCSGGQKEESSLMLTDPQPASPRRNQSWCYAALIYGGTAKWLLRSFSRRDPHTTLTLLPGKPFPVNMLPLCHWGKWQEEQEVAQHYYVIICASGNLPK